MLKKVLKQIEIIKSTRSGEPNFESHEVETNELQVAVLQYLQVRGAGTVIFHFFFLCLSRIHCKIIYSGLLVDFTCFPWTLTQKH